MRGVFVFFGAVTMTRFELYRNPQFIRRHRTLCQSWFAGHKLRDFFTGHILPARAIVSRAGFDLRATCSLRMGSWKLGGELTRFFRRIP